MGLEALADVQVVRPSLCTYVRAFVGEAIFRLACRRFLLFLHYFACSRSELNWLTVDFWAHQFHNVA